MTERETFNDQYFHKRCYTCDEFGYRSKEDYKERRKYCFELHRYIVAPDKLVCPLWKPTD
jgi:hypothetical protein